MTIQRRLLFVADMDTIVIRYEDNESVRYDRKEYVESLSKVRRDKSATGALHTGESVTVKTKSRVWKAVVVDPEPSAAANSASQNSRKRQAEAGASGRRKRSKTGGVQDPDVSIVLASFSAAPQSNTPSTLAVTPQGSSELPECHQATFLSILGPLLCLSWKMSVLLNNSSTDYTHSSSPLEKKCLKGWISWSNSFWTPELGQIHPLDVLRWWLHKHPLHSWQRKHGRISLWW